MIYRERYRNLKTTHPLQLPILQNGNLAFMQSHCFRKEEMLRSFKIKNYISF